MVIARVWLAGCSPAPRERRKWFQRKKRTTFSKSASLCSKLRFGEKLSEVSFCKSPSGFASSKVEQGKKKKKTSRRGKAASIQPGVRGRSSSLPAALPPCQALLCPCTALPGGNRKAFSNPGCRETGLQPQGVKVPSHARHFTTTSCVPHNSAPPACASPSRTLRGDTRLCVYPTESLRICISACKARQLPAVAWRLWVKFNRNLRVKFRQQEVAYSLTKGNVCATFWEQPLPNSTHTKCTGGQMLKVIN